MDTIPPRVNYGYYSFIPQTSGIYRIVCTITTKFYIGSAINLRDRCQRHFWALRQNKHENQHLQRAWNKYGEQSFTFEVIELVLIPFLIEREQFWFDKLSPFGKRGFNILPIAGSPLGYKHRPESIEKIRESNRRRELSPETLEKIRRANLGKRYPLGRTFSLEHREKLSQAKLGTSLSSETREKIGQASRGRKHSPEHIEKQRQAMLGREKSPEHREKLSQAAQDRWKRHPEEIEAIRSDYASGMTYRQLVKKYGIGTTQLVQILEDVSLSPGAPAKRQAMLLEKNQEKIEAKRAIGDKVRADREAGMTYRQLVNKYGISERVLYDIVKGIKWI